MTHFLACFECVPLLVRDKYDSKGKNVFFLFKLNQKSKEEGEEDERCNIFIEGNKSEKGITIYEIIKQHCKNINILALFCVIKQHFSREIGYNFEKKLL